MSRFNEDLGKVLKECRLNAHMTQQEVADKMHVSKMSVSHYECGDRQIYASTLRDYCKAVGVEMSSVLSKVEIK